ncbi:MAG TPA: hypothetical protein VNO83_17100 [Pseudonocardia sp.]|nr:hypothetical protein [Pseudonocardia sp.]
MVEIQFPNVLLAPPSTFTAVLNDNNGNPSSVLDAGTDITVDANWEISQLAALLLGGEWEVAAYAESIGPGPEVKLGAVTVPLNGGTTYSATITVPATTLPNPPAAGESGAYKVVVLLTHRNFGQVSDVSAIVEFPVVRIG